ncbi:hypothetical protein GCM10027093_20120 [Paraburkholderia jirisanensis]
MARGVVPTVCVQTMPVVVLLVVLLVVRLGVPAVTCNFSRSAATTPAADIGAAATVG